MPTALYRPSPLYRAHRLEQALDTPAHIYYHAARAANDEALSARESGERRVILFNPSGHGHFDLAAYEAFVADRLEDYSYTPTSEGQEARATVPA